MLSPYPRCCYCASRAKSPNTRVPSTRELKYSFEPRRWEPFNSNGLDIVSADECTLGHRLDLVPWYVTMIAAMAYFQNDTGFLSGIDGADCSAIIQSLSDKNATYLRRRRLLDGPDAHSKDLVIECAEDIRQNNSQAFVDLLLTQVSENVSEQTIFTLLVAGWLELQRGQWQATETLGREVALFGCGAFKAWCSGCRMAKS